MAMLLNRAETEYYGTDLIMIIEIAEDNPEEAFHAFAINSA